MHATLTPHFPNPLMPLNEFTVTGWEYMGDGEYVPSFQVNTYGIVAVLLQTTISVVYAYIYRIHVSLINDRMELLH